MSNFCHLHLHSEYSILEGACRLSELPDAVLADGQTAVAVTDTASMSGCVAFFRAAKEKGVHPIVGCEVKVSAAAGQEGTLVLLCENTEGYRNLCFLLSEYCLSAGLRQKPLGPDTLASHAAGLIALSGGPEGEVFALLNRGDAAQARKTAETYAEIFGKDSFFIELQNHGLTAERRLLSDQYELAKALGLGTVATNDVHYLRKDGAETVTALRCIREKITLAEAPGVPAEYELKSAAEMEQLFGGFAGALENTGKIAERCRFEFDFESRFLPSFPVPAGTAAKDLLRAQTDAGLAELEKNGLLPAEGYTAADYRARADYELGVIGSMGYDDYFLIVADYVGFAKKSGIPVGPGRGSGCGSLVAWCTGITDVDPLRYGLYFERFLNPERVSMPDIDIDFDCARRGEVLEYVRRRYGAECVSQIITFGTMASRGALRDACRLCGTDAAETARLMDLVPGSDVSLDEMRKDPRIAALCVSDSSAKKVFDVAKRLEGLPRNVSVHAAGVIITDGPVRNYLPLTLSGDTVISQYDMDTVASLGLLKFDFLALNYLTLIDDTEKAILRDYPAYDPAQMPLDDKKTFDLVSSGRTGGLFQIESGGLTALLRRMRPEKLGDLIDAIALYRPGPMDSIPAYLRGKQNPASVQYPHPLLEPLLKNTRGCIVYQEQVMSIFRTLADYTAGHADIVRRAMSKKKAKVLEAERGDFVAGAKEKGMTEEAAGALFDSMTSFAGYAFNQSHAVAYGLITYRTAYLKANYPAYYLAAMANSGGGAGRIAGEAAAAGIRILPPDVNTSAAAFRAEGNTVRFGLCGIREVGWTLASAIAGEAAEKPFASLPDLLDRLPDNLCQRRSLEALILSGAMDFTGLRRAGMMAYLDTLLSEKAGRDRSGIAGQMDIFSVQPETPQGEQPVPEAVLRLPEYPEKDLIAKETELCGISFRPAKPERPAAGGARPAAEKAPAQGGAGHPVVFIRVDSEQAEAYRKCVNLAEIFEGGCALCFYFRDTAGYRQYPHGIDRTSRVLGFFREIVGEDSVISRN